MDGIPPARTDKETIMFNTKKILTAAALALVSLAGTGVANADAWDRHDARIEHRLDRRDIRIDRRMDRVEQRRAVIDRVRLTESLRLHRYRVIGDPYFVHGRYVVRTHDRFGRIVFVQVDPYSGAFVREVIL
jgi:hypothetical protein